MVRRLEHALRRADLHQPAEVEDRDPVGEIADDPEVVRDEDVGGLLVPLKLAEEVQDRSLDGDVESGGRLVADDDARITGERPMRSRRAA